VCCALCAVRCVLCAVCCVLCAVCCVLCAVCCVASVCWAGSCFVDPQSPHAILPQPLPFPQYRTIRPPPPLQVVRRRLAVNDPYILAGNFSYEEGEGLEDDEVEGNARHLPRLMKDLPGGGLGQGVVMAVKDQSQEFEVEVIITHQVGG